MEYLVSLLILIVILVAAYYATRLVGKLSIGNQKSKYMEVVDRLGVDRNTSIVIVKINGENQVIAIGDHVIENLGVIGELGEMNIPSFEESFLNKITKNKTKSGE